MRRTRLCWLEAFEVPEADRYQVVTEHEPAHMIVQDTGLGIERTGDMTIVRVITRARSREAKASFYRLLQRLQTACGIAPSLAAKQRVRTSNCRQQSARSEAFDTLFNKHVYEV